MTWKTITMRPDSIFTFGKYKGHTLLKIIFLDPGWIQWSMNKKLIEISGDDYINMCSKIKEYDTIKEAVEREQYNIKSINKNEWGEEEKVYFISDQNGHIKIGRSMDVEERLKGLQTGNPNALEIIKTINGSNIREKELHDLLKPLNTRGEWFKDSKELRTIIDKLE